MQKEQLTLKLPMEPAVLSHAGNMLLDLADTLRDAAPTPEALGSTVAATTADTTPATATATTPADGGVVLDGDRLPWDVRIHGSGRTFLKTGPRAGKWKYARNLNEATILSVEAELRATMAAAPPAPTDTVDTGASAPPPPIDTVDTGATPAISFLELIPKVTALQHAGRITPDQVTAICVSLGVASLSLLGARPDLVPAVNLGVDAICPPLPTP